MSASPGAVTTPRVVVFLHGHDDDGDRWAAEAAAMAPDGAAVVRPTGPVPTAAGAAWFGHDGDGVPDPAQVRAALDVVDGELVAAATRHGVAPPEVALVGFSQGAAVALLHALVGDGPVRAGAVVAVAGWLPTVEGLDLRDRGTRTDRVLVAHGADDDVVPPLLGRSAARRIERGGTRVTTVERDAGHEPGPFTAVVRAWLAGAAPAGHGEPS